MDVIARGGFTLTDTVSEAALEFDSGRKDLLLRQGLEGAEPARV